MATIYVGSARIDENGNSTGGAAGDQKQTSSSADYAGEVSMQKMYTHSKGWYILRPTKTTHATKIASAMKTACNNAKIGYDQGNRLGIIKYGTATTTKTECDCSSLVRQCVIEATGTDPGNFTTANEATKLAATGLFEGKIAYVSQSKTPVYNGDILVTKSKGHTVIVVSGNPRSSTSTSASTSSTAAQSYSKSLAGTYEVTTKIGKLNMRKSPSTGTVIVQIPKGSKVQNYGYYTSVSGTKWLYVQYTKSSKTYTGFCSSKYLTKV